MALISTCVLFLEVEERIVHATWQCSHYYQSKSSANTRKDYGTTTFTFTCRYWLSKPLVVKHATVWKSYVRKLVLRHLLMVQVHMSACLMQQFLITVFARDAQVFVWIKHKSLIETWVDINLMYVGQAMNSAGAGPYSSVSWSQTPMSSPAAVSSVRATSTPRSIHVFWKEPLSNGSRILSYNIDVGDTRPLVSVDADTLDCNIVDLSPDTAYKWVVLSYASFVWFC